jgi:hypothetical protein
MLMSDGYGCVLIASSHIGLIPALRLFNLQCKGVDQDPE